MSVGKWLLGCSLFALAAAPAPVAWAQSAPLDAANRTEARANFQRGVAAYTSGDFATALEAFETAYRLAPNPVVRVNIANCHMQLGQPVAALENFEAFLQEAPRVAPAQRREIERQLADLQRQVGELRVRISPESVADAIITIDGRPAPASGRIRTAAGRHTVEATADGYIAERTVVSAVAGQSTEVGLRLRPRAPEPAPHATPPVAPPTTTVSTAATSFRAEETVTAPTAAPSDAAHHEAGLSPALFYTGAAVTVAGAVATTVFGVLALQANDAFNAAVERYRTNPGDTQAVDDGRSKANDATNMALAADVSLAVTGVAAIASIIVLTQTRFNRSREVSIAPTARAGGASIVLGGRF